MIQLMRGPLFFFVSLCLSYPVFSSDLDNDKAVLNEQKTSLVWFVRHFPPAMIRQGPFYGQGYIDQFLDLIAQRFSSYQHIQTTAVLTRALEEMKGSEKLLCHPALIATEARKKFLSFSDPIQVLIPNGLIVEGLNQQQFLPFMNEKGELSLEALLNSSYKVGVIKKRSYGKQIDQVLQKHANALVPIAGDDKLLTQLRKMQLREQFDAVISYSDELQLVTEESLLKPNEFVFIPIAEASMMANGRIGCATNNLSKKFITELNEWIATEKIRQSINAYYLRWLGTDAKRYYLERTTKEFS